MLNKKRFRSGLPTTAVQLNIPTSLLHMVSKTYPDRSLGEVVFLAVREMMERDRKNSLSARPVRVGQGTEEP